jgi:hypothetical protein
MLMILFLFMEHDIEKALNMKLALCLFEQLLGLIIHFTKVSYFVLVRQRMLTIVKKELFGCDTGSLPFRYLGILIHFKRLINGEWKPIEVRFEIKLSSCIGKMLLYGDHLVLINSVLASLRMFMLSSFEIPKGVKKRLDFSGLEFFGKVTHIKENID